MKRKRAQSISINTIIIAALALVVLIVLIAIFTGRVRIFSENLQSCTAKQGKCEPYSGELAKCPSSSQALITNTDCDKKNQICCVKVLNT